VSGPSPRLGDEDYQRILEFRTRLRRFLHWSEEQARAAGLTPAQHQLLLAVRGHRGEGPPTIGDLAGYLLLQHHSVVGLVDRAERAGLVRRVGDAEDRRVVRVELEAKGAAALEHLSAVNLAELRSLARAISLLDGGGEGGDPKR